MFLAILTLICAPMTINLGDPGLTIEETPKPIVLQGDFQPSASPQQLQPAASPQELQ